MTFLAWWIGVLVAACGWLWLRSVARLMSEIQRKKAELAAQRARERSAWVQAARRHRAARESLARLHQRIKGSNDAA